MNKNTIVKSGDMPKLRRVAIGKAIKARQEELEMGQGELQNKIGISVYSEFVNNVELGKVGIRVDRFCLIAFALNMTPSELLRKAGL